MLSIFNISVTFLSASLADWLNWKNNIYDCWNRSWLHLAPLITEQHRNPCLQSQGKKASLCISPRLICLSLFQSPKPNVVTQLNSIAVHNISQRQRKLYANPCINWMAVNDESVSCFLFCFAFLGQEGTSIHLNFIFNSNGIKVHFLCVDRQTYKQQQKEVVGNHMFEVTIWPS